MNRFDWNKLSPDEFERLQEYISCEPDERAERSACTSRCYLDAPKKLKDVVPILEHDPTWLAHRYDEVSRSFDVPEAWEEGTHSVSSHPLATRLSRFSTIPDIICR